MGNCKDMKEYTRISELKHAGQRITVPDHARDVTVEPSTKPGYLRVSYITPVHRVPIADASDSPAVSSGVDSAADDSPAYIN